MRSGKKRVFKEQKEVHEDDHDDVQSDPDDDDDDAPEDVGFVQAKKSALERISEQKEVSKVARDKKKERAKIKMDRIKDEKMKKAARKQEELSQEFLAELERVEKNAKKNNKDIMKNRVQKLDQEELDSEQQLDGQEDVSENGTRILSNGTTKVVAPGDTRYLNNVSKSALEFRNKMLYDGRKNRREPTVDAMLRMNKKKQVMRR